jgi:hypothetical protein
VRGSSRQIVTAVEGVGSQTDDEHLWFLLSSSCLLHWSRTCCFQTPACVSIIFTRPSVLLAPCSFYSPKTVFDLGKLKVCEMLFGWCETLPSLLWGSWLLSLVGWRLKSFFLRAFTRVWWTRRRIDSGWCRSKSQEQLQLRIIVVRSLWAFDWFQGFNEQKGSDVDPDFVTHLLCCG